MRGVLVLCALFLVALGLARGNPNAGIFLFVAAICLGAALILTRVRPWRRYAVPAVIIAGLGVAAWAAWASLQLFTPAFRASGVAFLPIDLLGRGMVCDRARLRRRRGWHRRGSIR